MISSAPVWRLKKGFDRRFMAGHPWVFSNELQASPKGINPGDRVELYSASGDFLAHGFGNPNSLIAFREVSRVRSDAAWDSEDALEARLLTAFKLRERLGVTGASFRWIHGESDGLSGLVIDRYVLAKPDSAVESVLVVQCHSAGMDRVSAEIIRAAKRVDSTVRHVILRNDVSARKYEGLEEYSKIVEGELPKAGGEPTEVLIRSLDGGTIPFSVDLLGGQKTGFFLDQTENIHGVLRHFLAAPKLPKRIRVLDLCTYVGQWSAQIGNALRNDPRASESEISFTLVDVSARALSLAERNVSRHGFRTEVRELDVLKQLDQLTGDYDLIICDPPALIQNRKHHPQGVAAYAKLNRESLKRLAPSGFFVTCSCSQLLTKEEFASAISKAERTSGARVSWVLQGTQAVDHPLRMEFPEGHYLKMHAGFRSEGTLS